LLPFKIPKIQFDGHAVLVLGGGSLAHCEKSTTDGAVDVEAPAAPPKLTTIVDRVKAIRPRRLSHIIAMLRAPLDAAAVRFPTRRVNMLASQPRY
jgi:hypothetical protein